MNGGRLLDFSAGGPLNWALDGGENMTVSIACLYNAE